VRKLIFATLLACFAMPVYAGLCPTCDPGEGGGGDGKPPPAAQKKLKVFAIDPAEDTIEMRMSNGLVLVIDEPLNKAFISGPNHSQELALSSVLLNWAGGNATKANQMRTKLKAILADPKRTAKLVQGAPVQGLMQGMPNGNSFNCNYFYVCNVMPTNSDFGGGISGPYSFGYWATPGSGGGVGTPDYNYWNSDRQDHCDDMGSNAMQASAGIAGAFAVCPFAETGVGALGCYAAAITVIDALDNYSANKAVCNSPYPGPGKW